ncbi:MAG: DUF427 domain-containing protein, partial [Actinomycetota bacterium]|nr:DUF427 domain-containing protein [Actinomycetota bacterium]
MSLTIGRGPFGAHRAGRFDFTAPEHVVYVEDFPRHVHALREGQRVVDSGRVKLVHETDRLPHYAFPAEDVRVEAVPEPHLEGYVHVAWDAVDAWFEEDEQVFVHVRDPYHRIDVVPTTRHVTVSLDGTVLAESTRVRGLYETGLPIRWYFPRDDVRTDLLARSDTVTHCPYKGAATHWSAVLEQRVVADVAWSYDAAVRREAEDVAGRICFYDERVDVDVDGVRVARPA